MSIIGINLLSGEVVIFFNGSKMVQQGEGMGSGLDRNARGILLFRNLGVLSCVLPIVIAAFGLIGMVSGRYILGSISPEYIPIAPSTAISFLLLSISIITCTYRPVTGMVRLGSILVSGCVSIFGLLKWAEYFAGRDVSFEEVLVPMRDKLGDISIGIMSPITGAGFFIAGICAVFYVYKKKANKEINGFGLSMGIMGSLLTLNSTIMLLGYVYKSPFLYENVSTVPMALTTAIAFLFLSLGMILLNGPKQFPLRVFMGNGTSARLSRVLLPLVFFIGVVQEIYDHSIPVKEQGALFMAAELIFTIGFSGAIIYIFVRITGIRIDKEHADLQLSNEILKNVKGGIHLIGLDDGIIKYANPGCELLFGYSPGEMVGKNAADINARGGKSPEEKRDKLMGLLVKTGKWSGELENVKKDGTSFWCYVKSTVFEHPEFGEVIVSVHTDITDRKKTEMRYRGIFDQAAVGVARVALDGKLLEVNEKLCGIVGYEKDELLTKTFQEITHPDDLEADMAYIEQLLKDEAKNYTIEKRYIKKNGDIVWIKLTESLMRDVNNRVEYFIVIIDDITEVKGIREKIRENETRFQKSQAIGHVGNWEYDPVKKMLWASDESKRIFGFDLGHDYFSLEEVEKCIPERERVDQALADLLEHNTKYDLEYDIITRDKGIRKTITSIAEVERNDKGEPVKIIGVINDVTERKQAEQALRGSEQRYFSLIDTLGVGVVLYAPDTSVLLSNPKASEILGLSIKEMQGKKAIDPSWSFVRKDGTPMPVEEYPINKVLKLKKTFSEESLGINRPDRKSIIWVNVNAALVFDENKEIKYATISFSDTTKRKEAEEEASKARVYLNTIIDMSPFPMWIADPEGTLIRTNRSLRNALNVTDEQLLGKYNVFKDENIIEKGLMPQVEDVFYKQKPASFELQWNAGKVRDVDFFDDSDRYLEVAMFPIVDNRGVIRNVICQWTDITGYKKAEEKIRSLAKFPSENPNPVLRIGKDGKVLYANDPAQKVLKCWNMAVDKKVPEKWQQVTREALKTGRNVLEKDKIGGQILSFGVSPVTESGYVNLYARDITEREQALQLLQNEKLLNKEYIDSLPGLFYVFDEERFVQWNKRWEFISGYSAKELSKMYGTDFFDGSDKTLIAERMKKVFVEGVADAEAEFITKNGKRTPYYFTGLRKEINGKPHLVGLGIDITERKKAENDLEKYKVHLEELVEWRTRELENANKELEAFSYSVSHDLRAPLRSLGGFSQILLKKGDKGLDPKTKEYLGRIIRAAERMGLLIDSLLMLSRVSRREINKEKLNISLMVEEIFSELLKEEPKRKVEVIIQPEVEAYGDKALVKILLQNIIANALKFTGKKPDARIKFGIKHYEGENQYFLQDNGAGFDEKYMDKLFGVFQRLHTQEEFPGIGVGLTTVYRIITKHGGRVWAEGHKGKGATFYFMLPK